MTKNIISIIGKSNVGKTTLIEKLITLISRRGIPVGTIKHHMHDFEADVEGKDSWRHQKAGARQCIISSPEKIAFFSKPSHEKTIDELCEYFDECDLIITDGYKGGNKPKIEVFRPSHYDVPIASANDQLLAYATDDADFKFPLAVPVLNLNQPEPIAEFILRYFKLEAGPKFIKD